jgi:hypothetical protein
MNRGRWRRLVFLLLAATCVPALFLVVLELALRSAPVPGFCAGAEL